jgi:hypothetical protein
VFIIQAPGESIVAKYIYCRGLIYALAVVGFISAFL